MDLKRRPLSVSLDGDMICLHRENRIFFLIWKEELDEAIGKLEAIRGAIE